MMLSAMDVPNGTVLATLGCGWKGFYWRYWPEGGIRTREAE